MATSHSSLFRESFAQGFGASPSPCRRVGKTEGGRSSNLRTWGRRLVPNLVLPLETTVVCMSNCQRVFAEFFLIGPNSVTISSGALNTTTQTNTRNSVSILLHSPPTQILPPGESTMGVPLAALPPLRVVEAML